LKNCRDFVGILNSGHTHVNVISLTHSRLEPRSSDAALDTSLVEYRYE
jgi:hypothetical protein